MLARHRNPTMRQDDMRVLFDHCYWAVGRVLAAADRLPTDRFAEAAGATVRGLRATLVHELDVEWSWRLRLQGESPEVWGPEAELDPLNFPTVSVLRERWRSDEAEMRAWIESLSDDDLARPIDIGGPTPFPLWYHFQHLLIHAMQQLADAATLLTAEGRSPGELDFLEFAEERAKIGALLGRMPAPR